LFSCGVYIDSIERDEMLVMNIDYLRIWKKAVIAYYHCSLLGRQMQTMLNLARLDNNTDKTSARPEM
jgi:hypothetical protein